MTTKLKEGAQVKTKAPCASCGEPCVPAEAVACPDCGVPHHVACWMESSRCGACRSERRFPEGMLLV